MKWRACVLATFFFSAAATAAPPVDVVAACEACHGKGGNSTTPLTPSIAGQPTTFLENQLIFFREGLRASAVMQGVAKGMKDAEIVALARHFASRPARRVVSAKADARRERRGREIASQRHCGQCHLPDYRGRAQIPRLAGQREDYLADTMVAYRDGKRTAADTTMIEVLAGLTNADMDALAHYLARRE